MANALNDSYLQTNLEKFYPPSVDPARYLFRETLIRNILVQIKQKRLLLIEAQAGQGKTIFTAQILSRLKAPFSWYQIGPEDADPVSFLCSLVACLTYSYPNFSSPLLADMIKKGEINAYEYQKFIDLLVADLAAVLKKDSFLVFEDVHLLETYPVSQAILFELIRTAPKHLRFILTSRRPMLQGKEQEPLIKNALKLGNEDIRLTEDEIFILFNNILKTAISRTEARELWKATEGWVMGLVLASREMISKGPSSQNVQSLKILHKAGAESLAEYFRREVFAKAVDDETRRVLCILCILSLLTTIPLTLAEQLTGNTEIGTLLNSLIERNYFVRRLNDEGTEFAFHHLCQEALRLIANEEISRLEQQHVYKVAGDYYSERKTIDDALTYYAKAQDYSAIEELLDQEGLTLYSLNRLALLESVLLQIPENVISAHGWLSFFQGIVLLQKDPPMSLQYLQGSLRIFSGKNNHFGRLHSLTKIVYFRLYVDAKYELALPLLEELEEEFDHLKSKLDALHIMNISHTLSSAFTFIKSDFSMSRKYCDIALQYASKLKMENTLAEVYSARVWACFANWKQWRREIEASRYLMRSIAVNSLNKMILHLCCINLLEMEGDFENYFHQEMQLTAAIENNLTARTFTGPFLFVWRIDIAIAQGKYAEALDLVRQAIQTDSSPHLSSQFYYYLALLQAISGDRDGAEISAKKSIALRAEVGGKIFVTMNQMINGSVYAILKMNTEAERILKKALKNSKDIGEEYLRAGAHAAYAYLLLHREENKLASEHVRECLRCLKENNYLHFFGWSPTIMQPVLEYAVAHDIEVQYAHKILRERMGIVIFPDSKSISLMKIQTLGHFAFSLNERTIRSEDMTPAMRELLALIVSSPDMKIYQEEILATLWPDITAAKARGRFDTLLLELRKTLKAAFGENQLDHYLVLKRGVLCLLNCRLDIDNIIEHAHKGLMHARKKEFWQASNQFYSASLQWQGRYLAGIRGNDIVNSKGYELEHLYNKMSVTWGKILFDAGQYEESINVLSQALKYDRTSDTLVSALYHAYLSSNQPVRANELLKKYEEALQAAEYDPEEISETLKEIWNIPVSKHYSIR